MSSGIEYMFVDGLLCQRLREQDIMYTNKYNWNDDGPYGDYRFFFMGHSWEELNQWEVINGDWILGKRADGTWGSTLHPGAPVCDVSNPFFFHQSEIEKALGIENYSYHNKRKIENVEDHLEVRYSSLYEQYDLERYQIMYLLAEMYQARAKKYRYLSGGSIKLEMPVPPEPKRVTKEIAF